MTIRKDKNNSEVFIVDTLTDMFELFKRNGIVVRVNDNPSCPRNYKLRELDIEESFEEDDDE